MKSHWRGLLALCVLVLGNAEVGHADDAIGVQEDAPARMRACNRFAVPHGWAAILPNGHQAQYGGKLVYGAVGYRADFAQVFDVSDKDLGNPADLAALFRGAHRWCSSHGYKSGFPNGEAGAGVHGVVGLNQNDVENGTVVVKEVLDADVHAPFSDDFDRFRKFHAWASSQGFATGYPNFEQASAGEGRTKFGAICIKKGVGIVFDVLAENVNPDPNKPIEATVASGNMSCRVRVSRTGEVDSTASAGIKKQSDTWFHDFVIFVMDENGNVLPGSWQTDRITIGSVVTPLGQPSYAEKSSDRHWTIPEASAKRACRIGVRMVQQKGGGTLLEQFLQLSDDYEKIRDSQIAKDAVKILAASSGG